MAAIAAGFLSAAGARAAAVPRGPLEISQQAYATSLSFDLRPEVERATLHLRRSDLRAIYQAIADAYGIRLLYDRDLQEARLAGNLDVEDATLKEALEAAGILTKTFVAPLDEHTGIVAADTTQKRGEYERQILASFQADNQTTPQQLTEISTALRTMLDLRRVTQDTRFNWITVRGLTRQVEAADRFFQTMEKPRGEVVIEVEIWEISSRRARELGLLPPQPFLLQFLGPSLSSGAAVFPFGLGRTLYGIILPGAGGQLSFSSSAVRSHQTLQLRASESQQASLLVGQRFPIVTSLVSSSILGSGTSASSTGFFPAIQYEDIGVTVKATPRLHAGREMTLQLDLAIRDLGSRNANGLPTITNRQFTGQIRLKDGESYILTGILNRSEQSTRTGYPWLSRLPGIGVLFASLKKQQDESELWILIRPRILRASPAEEFASRSIFFGREIAGLPPPPVEAIPTAPPPGVLPPGFQFPQPGVPPQPGAPVVLPPGAQPPFIPPQGVFPPGVFRPGFGPQPFPQPPQPQEQEQR